MARVRRRGSRSSPPRGTSVVEADGGPSSGMPEVAHGPLGGGTGTLALTVVVAAGMTVLTFVAVANLAPRASYVYKLVFERTWIQYATTFFFWLTMVILASNHLSYLRERRAYVRAREILDLPEFEVALLWTGAELVSARFTDDRNAEHRDSVVFSRVINGMDRLQKSQSTSELDDYFRGRGEVDSSALETSYAGVRYFTWLLPTLGFLGTVLGIGSGIAGFAGIIENAKDFSIVKQNLPTVTTQLGTAFDTTLLALLLTAVSVFYMSYVLRRQQGILEEIDTLCSDRACALFQEHSGQWEPLVKAVRTMVDDLRTTMNGNRAAVCQSVCTDLPPKVANSLLPKLQELADATDRNNKLLGDLVALLERRE